MKSLPSLLRAAALVAVATAAALWPALAQAATETLVPAEGQVAERIPAAPFLAGAYAFIWLAVVVYVVRVARGLSRVQSEIDDLRGKVDRLP